MKEELSGSSKLALAVIKGQRPEKQEKSTQDWKPTPKSGRQPVGTRSPGCFPRSQSARGPEVGGRAPPAAGRREDLQEKEEVEIPACSSRETHPSVAPGDVWSIFIVSLCNPCHLWVGFPLLEFCKKQIGYAACLRLARCKAVGRWRFPFNCGR